MEKPRIGATERGISTRAVEMIVAAAILLFGALIVYDSVRLGARWGEDGPQAGYFPFYVGLFICICSVVALVLAGARKIPGPRLFVNWAALKQVMQVLGPAAIYVLGIQLVGIYVASAVYIAIFMVWLGRYGVVLSTALGAGVMSAFFLTFEVWFKVPLYKGLFDPLAFLGY